MSATHLDPPSPAAAIGVPGGVVPEVVASVMAVTGWRRMRVAVYLAFALIAASAALQAWYTQRLADARSAHAHIVEAATRHTLQAQRLGRLAMQVAAQPASSGQATLELAQELAGARREAQPLPQLTGPIEPVAGVPDLRQALDHWRQARERLWSRADSLLGQVDAARPDGVKLAVDELQHELDAATVTAQELVAGLQAHSRALQSRGLRAARVGAALTIVLLLLALGVVAPALRALQAQARRLAQQAGENERLALVAEHTGNLVLIGDRERRLVWANPAYTRVSGRELHEVHGRALVELLQGQRTEQATLARLVAALHTAQALRLELLHRSRDGRDYWVDVDLQPLHNVGGELTGFIAVQTVITEQVTQRLRGAALLAALPTAVVVHGNEGQVLDANPAARRLLGVQPGDRADGLMQRRPLHDDLTPLGIGELPVQRSLRSGHGERGQVLGLDGADGDPRWLLVNTEALHDALGVSSGVVACYVDMTERRQLLDQLRESARQDPLTHLPNRHVVLERVQRAIEHRRRHPAYGFAVLFMDVDRFKQVNDTLGHEAGDELLCQLAGRLNETLRPGDAVARVGSELRTAARIGGDEFVIVLEGIRHVDEACLVAERLLLELSKPYTLGSNVVHVSVSVGIVGAEQAAADAVAVLRDCDTAMVEAKRAGRARWMVFDASMHERVKASLELEGELRRALAADELHVVYQPVVDLADRRWTAVEALVRWIHPERGEIVPGRFIGLAEECGLIADIGEVVLQKACAQFALWQQHWGGRAPPLLAVNLSRAQLKQAGLVPDICAVLDANGMRPEQLQLEVTESYAAQDEQVQSTLRLLKATGVRLALDDFGTGYSSLACLHQLPVDTVKIDRSFVAHARNVEYHRVLISATIRVARALGMITVAEGIESQDQAELMATLACDRGQGWLFGRPMSAEEVDRCIEHEASDSMA